MEKKESKKAFIEWFLVIITGIIINFLCVLIFSITSHAQGLPVYVDNESFVGVYGLTAEQFVYTVNNSSYFLNNGFHIDLETPGTFLYNGFENGYNYTKICMPLDAYSGDFSTANGVVYNTWDSSTNYLSLTSRYKTYLLYERGSLNDALAFYYWFTTSPGNITFSFYGDTGLEIGYLVSDYNWFVDPSLKIATNEAIPVLDIGHATQPEPFESPTLASGSNYTLPREVPESPTIINYSWTTYNSPSIDNSTVESLLESLIDVARYNSGYLTTNMSNEFDNLINNIKGFSDYLGKTIQYYGGLIVSNIQNGITTLYNNMESLVKPIFDTLSAFKDSIEEKLTDLTDKFEEFADLFINPFDEEEFEEQIENSSFFTNYNAIIDNCEEITEIFEYAEERDHFSLYISFENPFADSQHKIISSEINFDWLVPLRSVYRPFIWVCVLIELFVGGARVLTRIIGGHGIG